ncbi:MAG: hypothetical protein QXX68_00060 [Candidatus Pacearchaeota archaeon]
MEKEEKINSEQFYEILTKDDLGWQSLIYELIKTERLDPWDINISLLAQRYLETIQKMEEANFFISSKMLLACAILLKMKSEILNSNIIREIDEMLYGKKEEKKITKEIEIIEEEFPILIPRTPLPRQKKVSLDELMRALNKAIETETRRIKKIVGKKHAENISKLFMPKDNRIPLKERISFIVKELEKHFEELKKEEITFSELAPTKEEKKSLFLPFLQLANHGKLYFKQYYHFEEIFIKLEKYEEEQEHLLEKEELKN